MKRGVAIFPLWLFCFVEDLSFLLATDESSHSRTRERADQEAAVGRRRIGQAGMGILEVNSPLGSNS